MTSPQETRKLELTLGLLESVRARAEEPTRQLMRELRTLLKDEKKEFNRVLKLVDAHAPGGVDWMRSTIAPSN